MIKPNRSDWLRGVQTVAVALVMLGASLVAMTVGVTLAPWQPRRVQR